MPAGRYIVSPQKRRNQKVSCKESTKQESCRHQTTHMPRWLKADINLRGRRMERSGDKYSP
jgi:hypothetical protein